MPGQQRICRVADGDFFKAIRGGRLTLVTDEIEGFDETGIRLASGQRLEADIVIAATGLVLQALGGAAYEVDGQAIDPGKLLIFKGFMYSNVPNLIYFTGYTNPISGMFHELNVDARRIARAIANGLARS